MYKYTLEKLTNKVGLDILCSHISVHINIERRILVDNQYNTFGSFLQAKRSGKKTLRAFAADIGVTPGYISDIENDRRDPPGKDLLDKMAEILGITGSELVQFYDLAGQVEKRCLLICRSIL